MNDPNNTQTIRRNKLDLLFDKKGGNVLSVFFTAGFPGPDDTGKILMDLQDAGADMVEIGMPFSDPIADGETIQRSSQKSIENGTTIARIFEQLKEVKERVEIPIILMGYLNPVFQYGWENFCRDCAEAGVDGLILPDLPLNEFESIYKPALTANGLKISHLITPQTPDDRVKKIDALADAFIYVVSSYATTGKSADLSEKQIRYFERISEMNLQNKKIIGFGIHDKETFERACRYADGAIIGSAFIRNLEEGYSTERIYHFIKSIRT